MEKKTIIFFAEFRLTNIKEPEAKEQNFDPVFSEALTSTPFKVEIRDETTLANIFRQKPHVPK